MFCKVLIMLVLSLSVNSRASFAETDEELFNEIDKTAASIDFNNDPLENINRSIFNFNVIFWDNVLVPFNRVWMKIPTDIRNTIHRYGENYHTTPRNMFYSVFDLDLKAISISFWRFTINTIFGLFGTFDVAADVGLKPYEKSLGDILYFYHIPRGPYLMIPLLGPSNLRDAAGTIIEWLLTSYFCMHWLIGDWTYLFSYQYVFHPLYLPFNKLMYTTWIGYFIKLPYYGNIIALQEPKIAFLTTSAIDRYNSFKTGYYQSQNKHEQEYIKLRYNGSINNTNICDYDGLIEQAEECSDDPKTYTFSNKLHHNQ